MSTKRELQSEIESLKRDIDCITNRIKEREEELSKYSAPDRIRDADVGETLADGCVLIDFLRGKDRAWAILGAPVETIQYTTLKDMDKIKKELSLGPEWFLPTHQIAKSICIDPCHFELLPVGEYWTSISENEYILIAENNALVFATLRYANNNNLSRLAWYCKIVEFSVHPSYDYLPY
jgi:hypothetical protein